MSAPKRAGSRLPRLTINRKGWKAMTKKKRKKIKRMGHPSAVRNEGVDIKKATVKTRGNDSEDAKSPLWGGEKRVTLGHPGGSRQKGEEWGGGDMCPNCLNWQKRQSEKRATLVSY